MELTDRCSFPAIKWKLKNLQGLKDKQPEKHSAFFGRFNKGFIHSLPLYQYRTPARPLVIQDIAGKFYN
ncbi:MAG: hypothetical protein ACTHMI_04025 [Mucilaginibacter sp.]